MPYHALGEISLQCQTLISELLAQQGRSLLSHSYQSGDILLSQGTVQKSAYFLMSGLLASSAILEDGNIRHKEFYFPNELCILYAEWLRASPSFYQISVLQSAEIVEVPLTLLAQPRWQTLKLRLIEQQLLFKEAKEAFLLLNTPEQRYRFIAKYRPNWLKQLANQDLANYLAITPQALSRLKSRIKQT